MTGLAGWLAGWLGRQADADERRAKAVLERKAERGWESEDDAWDGAGPGGITEWAAYGWADRALAEVAFKRAVIALCSTETGETGGKPLGIRLLHGMAEVYKDRPGYREALR